MDKFGSDFISLKVGKTTYKVSLCESTPGTPKCDFHFIGQGGYVGHVSHKAGFGPRGFQQWAGTSLRVEPTIYNHPETQAFISTLREMFPNGMPSATTVGRKIKDEKPALKQLVMDLGKENPKKENKISAEDDWKLKALEAQLEWIKNSVIPIPSKK